MSTNYYHEWPLKTVIAAEKKIDSLITKEELRLVCECADQCPAYAEINGKNGTKLYVARKKNWNSKHKCYQYHAQLLDKDLNVLESVQYRQAVKGDAGFGIGEFVRCEDGYYVEPLMHMALTVLRRTGR